MRVRRTSVAAVSSVIAACSVLVGVTTTAHADAEQGVMLPAGPVGQHLFRLSGGSDGEVYAEWGTNQISSTLYRTPADGSGTWQQVLDPITDGPLNHLYAVRDGVAIQTTGSFTPPAGGGLCQAYRIVTATTAWDTSSLSACGALPVVGAGGRLLELQRHLPGTGQVVNDVYDLTQPPEAGPVRTTSLPTGISGSWVWTSGARGILTGHDITGAHQDVTVDAGDDCAYTEILDVVGDPDSGPAWATTTCNVGTGTDVLVDLTGATGPMRISEARLGLGFTYVGALTGSDHVVRVSDFGHSVVDHDYGPWASGTLWSDERSGAMSSGLDDGTPYVAFRSGTDGIAVASLPWLGSPPTPATDTTAPTVTATAGSPAFVRREKGGTPLTFGWTAFDDDQGVATADVQVKETIATGPGWLPVEGGSHRLLGDEINYDESNYGHVCFRVRLTDRVGNRSAWSSPRCTWVDDGRPWMRDGRADHPFWWRGVLNGIGRQAVTYRFHGTDDISIAGYDVQQRTARDGGELRRWHTVAHGLSRGRYPTTIGAGQEKCFRARAHDQVGRVSRYGDRWCVISPIDDRSFALHGGRHVAVRGALGGSVSKLPWHGPDATHPHVRGRSLAVLARSDLGGCPRVWWGGQSVMSRSCIGGRERRNGFTWYLVRLRKVHHGTVRVAASVASNWTEVDAVAVGR